MSNYVNKEENQKEKMSIRRIIPVHNETSIITCKMIAGGLSGSLGTIIGKL